MSKAGKKIEEGLKDALDYVKNHRPGTFGCHEALHMASYFASAVNEELTEHPAISHVPAWKKLAARAEETLVELYNEIAKVHNLHGENDQEEPRAR
jgi:hypothetical protein